MKSGIERDDTMLLLENRFWYAMGQYFGSAPVAQLDRAVVS